jgi:TonB family protein
MTRGKSICNVLKAIRKQIADANGISYQPTPCGYRGECLGTCPHCEAEVRYIENSLNALRKAGKVITIVGLSSGLAAFTSCKEGRPSNAPQAQRANVEVTTGKVLVAPSKKKVDKSGFIEGDVRWNPAYAANMKKSVGFEVPVVRKPSTPARKRKDVMGTAPAIITGNADPIAEPVDTIAEPVDTLPDFVFDEPDEQMPSFPGGAEAMMQYIRENLRYPNTEEDVTGRVVISLIVEADGSLSNLKVTKFLDPVFDEEALRVVRSMPRWTPGTQNGKAVRVRYNIPVTFRLQ